MSQTQTTTLTSADEPTTVRQILQVYDIHQTAGELSSETSGWSQESQWQEQLQRQDWASNYNRIPPYREPMRSHRFRDRPAGLTTGDASFVVMMFCGVYVVSGVYKVWRRTFGLFVDWPWGYPIGGES